MKLERAKGTRDFSPEEVMLRNDVIDIIRKTFEKYGYPPLETPTIERYDVVTAKGSISEEDDAFKELFTLEDNGKRKLAMRFEFTFQLARYIAMNPSIKLPFKRYQIGPVYRDGPIKTGRYREFMQCDADVIGDKSMYAEAELLAMAREVYEALELQVNLEVNSRKLLNDILDKAKVTEDKQESAIVAIDKLLKIGEDGVKKELLDRGLKAKQIKEILALIEIQGENEEKLVILQNKLGNSDGVKEVANLLDACRTFGVSVSFTPSLARGLGYYTGIIYEASPAEPMPVNCSLGAGGRWDEMVGKYLGNTKLNYPAVGFSFGLEPMMEVLKEKRGLNKQTPTKIYLIPIKNTEKVIPILQKLRSQGVNAAMDLQGKNLSKNLDYANVYNIPFVGIIGENELNQGKIQVKNMETGEEQLMTVDEISSL